MQFDIGPHVDDEALEQYLLRRLSVDEIVAIDEHLLVCSSCQSKAEEADEFLRVAKAALRGSAVSSRAPRFRLPVGPPAYAWSGALACAVVMAALSFGVFVSRDRGLADAQPYQVHLYAMRGSDAAVAHARSGKQLMVDLDTAGLPTAGQSVVKVIDTRGAVVWKAEAGALRDPVRVKVGRVLPPGRYWVRLIQGDVLLREYSLTLD